MTYAEKLLDPRWQKKRLEILERDEWTCCYCGDKGTTLHVHHLYYEKGKEPWEVEDHGLLCLCKNCHDLEHAKLSLTPLEAILLQELQMAILLNRNPQSMKIVFDALRKYRGFQNG